LSQLVLWLSARTWCDVCSSVSSSVSADDLSWSKSDESRLRQHLVRLRDERSVVRLTVVDLESVHLDPFTCEPRQDACEAQKLDLENAVLMQELMAVKVTDLTHTYHCLIPVTICSVMRLHFICEYLSQAIGWKVCFQDISDESKNCEV